MQLVSVTRRTKNSLVFEYSANDNIHLPIKLLGLIVNGLQFSQDKVCAIECIFGWLGVTYNLGQNCWDNSNWLAILTVIIINSTVLPLSPISMLFRCWKTSLMHRQTFKTTLSEGGGEGKHFCDYDCVSIPGKEEISTRFWFVSTSFVRGCRYDRKRGASRQAGSEIVQYLDPLHAPLLLFRHTNALFYAPIASKTSHKMLIMLAVPFFFQKNDEICACNANYAKNYASTICQRLQ